VPRFPRVVSPIATLFTRDGIDVLLVSVEVWPEHVVVRFAASGGRADELGSDLLAPLELTLEDDVGTVYRARSSNIGGTGSEWHGDWFFAGGVPESVRCLTVRVSPPDGEAASTDLPLAGA
jgi:hypothetical protein